MRFEIGLALYVLEHYTSKDIPLLAQQSLEEGIDTPSLRILAWLDDPWEIDEYLKETLKEMDMSIPTKEEAGFILMEYYLRLIVYEGIDPEEGIKQIIMKVIRSMTYAGQEDYKYAYEHIGFHTLYGLYYTIDDYKNPLIQFSEKKRDKGVREGKRMIVEESKALLSELDSIKKRVLEK